MVYGIKRDTSSTSTTWERIEDSIGLEANAVLPESGTSTTANTNVKNDFDNIYPWSEIKSYNYNANTKKVTYLTVTFSSISVIIGSIIGFLPVSVLI